MKLVHLNKEQAKEEDHTQEIKTLEQTIREHPANDKAWIRLMIIYRKQKEYKKELKTINAAIKTFEELFKKREPAYNTRVKSLSKALSKALGLTDKKGNSLYEMGDLAKWKRRKQAVLKKIKT
jgi:tetratricopeptide (TPR) repeat protein